MDDCKDYKYAYLALGMVAAAAMFVIEILAWSWLTHA